MDYTILCGNIILLILIILVIVYLLKDKIKESFFNNHNNCNAESSAETTLDEEGNLVPVPTPNLPPPNYNPNEQYLCKNIGWTNTSTPYLQESGRAWYDAELKCKKDFQCNSFSFYGDSDTTSGDVNYYSSSSPSEVLDGVWTGQNLYVKTTEPCTTTQLVTFNNQDSSGNLQSSKIQDIYFPYENKFITKTRDYLNNYNDEQISDS